MWHADSQMSLNGSGEGRSVKMDKLDKLFLGYLKKCDPTLKWHRRELSEAVEHLKSIYRNNSQKIFYAAKLSGAMRDRYCISALKDGLGKVLKHYAESIVVARRDRYCMPDGRFSAPFDFLKPSAYVEKLDVNEASVDEFEALEGIGRELAERI